MRGRFASAPLLQFWPDVGESSEFWPPADEDVNVAFERVRIVRESPHVIHMLKQFLECFLRVIQHDQAFAAVSSGSPEEKGVISAEGRGQTIFPAQKIDGARLAVILSENAAIGALG